MASAELSGRGDEGLLPQPHGPRRSSNIWSRVNLPAANVQAAVHAAADVTRDRCHGSSTAGKHHLMQMSFILVFFIAFSLFAFVVGPALRIEDRPAFKRPDKKVRWLF
jgi:hypothetical protein